MLLLLLLLLLLQVQDLALQFLTAWAAAGQAQAQLLSQQGLAPALGRLAMDAVAQGEQGRELQASVCRCEDVRTSSGRLWNCCVCSAGTAAPSMACAGVQTARQLKGSCQVIVRWLG
jgi:hypothetical protein